MAFMPTKPKLDETEDDLDPRIKAYLSRQMRGADAEQTPEYRASMRADASDAASQKRSNDLGALLMNSASMMGQYGGKRADTSGIERFAKDQNDDIDRTRPEKPQGLDPKVLDYLRAQQAATSQANTRRAVLDSQTKIAGERATAAKAKEERDYGLKREEIGLKQEELVLRRGERADDREIKREVAAKEKDPKPDQFKAAGFARRLEQAEDVFDDLVSSGYDRTDKAGAAFNRVAPAAMESADFKVNDQAERNFINSVLRRESGASISPTEYGSAEKQYFPRPGDSQELVGQKKLNRQQVLESLKAEAGGAYERVPRVSGVAEKRRPASGTATAAPAPLASPAPAGKVRVKSPNGKIGLIPAAQLEKALTEGYSEVN